MLYVIQAATQETTGWPSSSCVELADQLPAVTDPTMSHVFLELCRIPRRKVSLEWVHIGSTIAMPFVASAVMWSGGEELLLLSVEMSVQ